MTNKPLMMVLYKTQEAGDSSKPDHWFTDILSGRGPTHQFHEGEIKEARENIKSFPVWHLPIHYNYKSFHTIPLMRITDTCFRGLCCSHGNSLSKWQLRELCANRDIPTHMHAHIHTHTDKYSWSKPGHLAWRWDTKMLPDTKCRYDATSPQLTKDI